MSEKNLEQINPAKSLVVKFANKFGVDSNKLMNTLKATAFKQKEGEKEVSNEQMMALLVVADQYGLNPFTKEIYAFPDKQNGIVPVVGLDGWSRIANEQQDFDGMEFRQSEEIVTLEGAKPCPAWMEIIIYRKNRAHPTIIREYLDEVYRAPFKNKSTGYVSQGPWQTHTKRLLRHKTMIQGTRLAFGFVGIYDQDEAERIVDGQIIDMETSSSDSLKNLANSAKTGNTILGDVVEIKDKAEIIQEPENPDQTGEASPGEDFDLEQPDATTADTGQNEVTIVDVRAKLKDLAVKVKKAKTVQQWGDISEIAITTLDLLNAIVMEKKDYDGITNTLNGYLEQAEKALGV